MTAAQPPHPDPNSPRALSPRYGRLLLAVAVGFLLLTPVAAIAASTPELAYGSAPAVAPGHSAVPAAPSLASVLETVTPPSNSGPYALPDSTLATFAAFERGGALSHVEYPRPASFGSQNGTLFEANGSIEKGVLPTQSVADPVAIAFDPTAGTVFIAGGFSSTIGQYNTTDGSLVTFTQLPYFGFAPNVPISELTSLTFDAPLGILFASSPLFGIWAINPSNGSIENEYTTYDTPGALAIDSSGNTLFAALPFNASVEEISAATGAIERNATVGEDPDALTYDAGSSQLYVANYNSNNVSIIDPSTGSTTGSIAVGVGPVALSVVASGDALWTLAQGSGNISVYGSGKLSSISLPTGSAGAASSLLLDSAQNAMYVLNAPTGDLAVFNATSRAAGTSLSVGGLLWGSAYDSSQGLLELAQLSSNSLVEVNDATGSIAHTFRLGAYPMATVYSATAGIVYVADPSVYWLTELDARTDAVVGSIPLTSPGFGMAYSSVANLIAITELDGSVQFISTASDSAVGAWSPGVGITLFQGVYGNGEFFFTGSNPGSNNSTFGDEIFVVSASGYSEIGEITSGSYDNGLTYDSTTRYVDVVSNNSVLEISTVTDNYYGRIALPSTTLPWGGLIAWDNVSNELYVTGEFTPAIAILNLTNASHDSNQSLDSISPHGPFFDPTSIVYIRQVNSVYVSDASTGFTYQFIRGGTFVYTVSDLYTGVGPASVAFSTLSGVLYVSNAEGATITLLSIDPIEVAPMYAQLQISPATVQVGSAVTLRATATYPQWSDNFTYTGLPGSCPSVNQSLWSCTAGAANSFTVTVKARNPFGLSSTATASFVVFEPLAIVSFTASPGAITLGQKFQIETGYSGGVAPTTVGYPTRPTGCAATASVNWTCAPTAAGNFTLELVVSDADGNTRSANLSIIVNPHLVVTLALSTNSTESGHPVTFTTTVTGGTAPFTYTYTGLPAGCNAANASTVSCSPTTGGIYPVVVKVADADGVTTSAPAQLVVSSPASSNNNGAGALTTTDILLIVVLIVVAVIAVVALATRNRGGAPAASTRRRPTEPPTDEEPMAEEQPFAEPEGPGETIMPPPPPQRPVVPVAAAPPPNNPSAPGAGAIEEEPAQRFYAGSNVEAASTAGSKRPSLVCPKCGTVNESWLTNCRKCKRSLFSTGGT